jgi:hypothetical protein
MTLVIIAVSVVFSIVLIVVVFKYASNMMGDSKVLDAGVPGQAVVMSLEPTGTVINDLYYVCNVGLRVTVPAQPTYDVMITQSVPLHAMARVDPGRSVGVKVDPVDRTKVVIDWNMAAVAPAGPSPAGPGVVAGPAGVAGADLSASDIAGAVAMAGDAAGMVQSGIVISSTVDVLRDGQRVLGVLTEYAATGGTPRSLGLTPSRPEFLDDPMYAVTLQLHIANTAPIEAKVIQRVPRAQVANLAMGQQFNVAVDPSNPTRNVAIDWGDIPI